MKNIHFNLILITIASLLIFINDAISQSIFNSTYDFQNGSETAFHITPYEDDYIVIGNGNGFEIGNYEDSKIKILRINALGDTIWKRVYGTQDINYFTNSLSATITYDGNIIFCGTKTTATKSHCFLMKINPVTGDSIFKRDYDFDDLLAAIQVRELSNHDLIYAYLDYTSNSPYAFMRLTETGDIIWNRTYMFTNEYCPSDFILMPGDTIYIPSCNAEILGPGYHIRKIDSSGTVVDQDYYTGDYIFALWKSQFSGFYAVGGTVSGPPYRAYLCKLNNEGSIQWRFYPNINIDTLNSKEIYCMLPGETSNGDVFVAGYFGANPVGNYKGIICKIDSFGDSYWERYYTYTLDNYYDMINSISLTNDGGAIVVGSNLTSDFKEATNFWILRIDSMGCVTPDCSAIDDYISNVAEHPHVLKIAPNPLNTTSVVSLYDTNDIYFDELFYELYSFNGKLVTKLPIIGSNLSYQNKEINFTVSRGNLPEGIYFIRIINDSNVVATEKLIIE